MPAQKKSQISVEYLMILGIGFSILLILNGIFFAYFNGEKKSLNNKHILNIGEEIMKKTEQIYFLGNGNRITIDTKFPEGVENISIKHIINHTETSGQNISFDLLNITYIGDKQIITNIFETNKHYIRFNCSRCNHDTANHVSYYNQSDFSPGFKKIRIESKGSFVSIDFVKE